MDSFNLYITLNDYFYSPLAGVWFTIFVDFGTVLANQLTRCFPNQNAFLKELNGDMHWEWHYNQFSDQTNNNFFNGLLWFFALKLWLILKSILGFALISTVTAFVFRIGLMTSSVFLVFCGINRLLYQ